MVLFRIAPLFLFLLTVPNPASAQWQMLPSTSTAGLRGIHTVGRKVAWASGTNGTVLRTLDGGAHWQACPVPAGAEKLDFRAVWASDAKTAMVMSAGPGEQSRLYRTADGCAHWTLVQTNQDKDGFWDAMVFHDKGGVLIGDPVQGHFYTEFTPAGRGWVVDDKPCTARDGEAAFAASNSSVVVFGLDRYMLGTGGKSGARVLLSPRLADKKECVGVPVPVAGGNESSGIFSLAFRDDKHGVAVGGDYKKPAETAGTAAWTSDGGRHWTAASTPPHGYRSSVAWDAGQKVWIAAGTNGSDISRDGGKTWAPLDNGNWNALSPPFAVGPNGRIGKLDPKALARE